ncbi:MAG: membrane protein [Limisphaerales bacterium]|nr:MAG: membrane protein [Limisphaerales bacterium]KAG0509226.1 MAG: membrane protein [Limisphaerales bacterium]TXT52235.1 MAG: membrane protein [Limisphaerales bacterium]
MSEEKPVFRGSSSQVLNLAHFAGAIVLGGVTLFASTQFGGWLAALVVLPLAYAGWRGWLIASRVYEITTERIKVTTGLLNKHTDDLELYRVKDTVLEEPVLLRLAGAGNIVLTTSDTTTPTLVLEGITGAKEVREELRKHIEACRDRKRTRLTELE